MRDGLASGNGSPLCRAKNVAAAAAATNILCRRGRRKEGRPLQALAHSPARESEVKKGRNGRERERERTRLQLQTTTGNEIMAAKRSRLASRPVRPSSVVENAQQQQQRTALRTQRHHAFQLRVRDGAVRRERRRKDCRGHKSGTQVSREDGRGNGGRAGGGGGGTHSKFGFTILLGRGKRAAAGNQSELGRRSPLRTACARTASAATLASRNSKALRALPLYEAAMATTTTKSSNFDSFHETIIFSRSPPPASAPPVGTGTVCRSIIFPSSVIKRMNQLPKNVA